MSQWSRDMPSQPSATGQVTFFDPSKFQKSPSNFPNIPTSQPLQSSPPAADHFSHQAVNHLGNQDVNTDQAANQGSWNTWGGEAYNPYANFGANQGDNVKNQPATTDASNFNQQWYGQDQWNSVPQQNLVSQEVDPNQQNWDPNTQSWNPNQYNYQQGMDPNQYEGYNQYWAGGENGVNGYENGNENYQNTDVNSQKTDVNSQNVASANYYTPDYNSQFAQSTVVNNEAGVVHDLGASGTSSESSDSHIQGENSDSLDVSQSTESESINQSLGHQEDGMVDGFLNNDDYVEENVHKEEHNRDQLVPTESDHSKVSTNVNNASNNNTNVAADHHGNVYANQEVELTSQMMAVSLQGIEAMSDELTSQGNHPNVHVPVSTNQFNQSQNHPPQQFSAPFIVQQNQSAVNAPFVPPEEKSRQEEVTPSHDLVKNNQTSKEANKASPPFCDWEMVPPVGMSALLHSRNASLDNNVHFFISSNNSSTRVSPATSSLAGDDREVAGHSVGKEAAVLPVQSLQTAAPPTSQISPSGAVTTNPPGMSLGPPPQMMVTNVGGNRFRKSPKSNITNNDESVLSSTQLDVTRPNYENSPVVLNQSLSPIPQTFETLSQHGRRGESESPDFQMSNVSSNPGSAQDTPVSSGSRKSTVVPQSPILPRKESPFQPPAVIKSITDSRIKPVKASHDIPGVSSQENKPSDMGKGSHYDRRRPRTSDRDVDRLEGRKTPDWDSGTRRGEGRKTPDWDSATRRVEGRKTPDWDTVTRRGEGRKTPDWDSGTKRVEGRKTPEWDSKGRSERDGGHRDRDRNRYERDKGERDDKVSSRPPLDPSSSSNRAPPSKTRQSAFHHIQTSRIKNNVSPATTLWDTPENLPAVSNILLVPAKSSISDSGNKDTAAPAVLSPVATLITSLTEHIKTEESPEKDKGYGQSKNRNESDRDKDTRDRYRERDSREPNVKTGYRDRDRGDIKGNKSYESLRDRDRGLKDSRNNSREQLSMYGSRNSIDQDDPRDRSRRGDSRDRERGPRDRDDYHDKYRDRDRERDRPPSRTASTVDGRRDYRDRDKDYRRTDRYERPRSRQGERPSSRQGDYDRADPYYKDRYRPGYDYDDYYRRGGQYYYDYYYGQGQYGQAGYYDEHGYYHADPNASRYQYDPYQRRSRTGTPGSLSDGGEEISKIDDKSKTSEPKSEVKRFDYPPDLHDYSRAGGYDDYYNYYGYEQNGHRWDPDISAWVATTTDAVPQRQTPEKFMIPHMRACFGPNGQLVKVLPNRPADGQPGTIEIHDVQELLAESEESQMLQEFPGPLIKGDTHKNDVLLFCQSKAKACTEDMDLEDRESAELIWRFLELLIKQNGTVVGTDIADLLLQGHEPTTLDYRRTGMKIAASMDNLDAEDDTEETRLSRGPTPVDRSMVNKTKPLEEVTDRFRHLLLYGRKKDALDWAMKNNLWGHALFLASKMDSRAHANVMTRFANVAMRMNDPLQTLYQLMSGRQPAAVTCVTEERWGDWRPHLAMILSNHTQKPDLDRKCITTLGDTLASRGFLHASHFCYLMSQTSFGSYNKKSSKIVLIGSSHCLPIEFFASDEAIQCTEIYEYALALGNTMVNLINFQYFKYLYATKLADYGYVQEALRYCEVISRNINANPAYYQQTLVKLVYDLSNQLKFSDPSNLEETDDFVDPDWLGCLHTTLVQFEEGAIQPMSGSATPAYLPGTSASSESGEVGMYMQGSDNGGMYTQSQDSSYMPNSGGMYSIQEQSALQHRGNTNEEVSYQQPEVAPFNPGSENFQGQYHVTDGSQTQYTGHQMTTTDNQVPYQPVVEGYTQQPEQLHWPEQPTQMTNQIAGYDSANQQQSNLTNQNALNYQDGQHQTTPNQPFGTNQIPRNWSHGQHHQQQTGFPADVNLGESQVSAKSHESAQPSSLASTSSFSQAEGEEDDVDAGNATAHQQPSIFDLQPAQQRIVAPRLRKRTISETSAGSGGGGNHGSKPQKSADNKDSLSQSKPKSGGGGIFAKIGGLFSRKNEMKLPDDKEPSIVWDPVKKRWIDKDGGGEEEDKPIVPPPKDADLSGSGPPSVPQAMAQSVPTFNTNTSEPPPPSMGNRFSRKKGLGARSQYVDVMNPKPTSTGTHVPTSLFNTLPSSHSAPAIFNPSGSADVSSTEPITQSPRQDTIPEERQNSGADHSNMPPPATGGLHLPPLNDNLSRTSSMSSLSKEVQQILSKRTDQALAEEPPVGPGLTSTPAMFNPSQFQGSQAFKQPTAGPGNRLTSRRVYPK